MIALNLQPAGGTIPPIAIDVKNFLLSRCRGRFADVGLVVFEKWVR